MLTILFLFYIMFRSFLCAAFVVKKASLLSNDVYVTSNFLEVSV